MFSHDTSWPYFMLTQCHSHILSLNYCQDVIIDRRELKLLKCFVTSSSMTFIPTVMKIHQVETHCPRCKWKDNIKMDLEEVGGGRGD